MKGPGAGCSPEVPSGNRPGEARLNQAMLYIEDNESNIFLVQALLKRRPQIELHVAMTGREGVQAAIDKQPGLILLDNRLPTRLAVRFSASLPRRRPRRPYRSLSSAATPAR